MISLVDKKIRGFKGLTQIKKPTGCLNLCESAKSVDKSLGVLGVSLRLRHRFSSFSYLGEKGLAVNVQKMRGKIGQNGQNGRAAVGN
ncbi:MAG: hypothetical protein HY098_08155 [Nitrospinae bacterium]|nr:hypothetical protein [Nitrospinota bacterium]